MARQPDKHSSRSHSAAEGFKAAAGALKEAGLQADTFVRSAANTATFGLADNAEAAADAFSAWMTCRLIARASLSPA